MQMIYFIFRFLVPLNMWFLADYMFYFVGICLWKATIFAFFDLSFMVKTHYQGFVHCIIISIRHMKRMGSYINVSVCLFCRMSVLKAWFNELEI